MANDSQVKISELPQVATLTGAELIEVVQNGDNKKLPLALLAEGSIGAPGKSAYVLATDAGYAGTLEQWIESLKGPAGATAYQLAVQSGYSGTMTAWLASLKGEPGAAGRSAFLSAVAAGYTGTEAQWVESLKGTNGKSAYQSALDNGFVGSEAVWLASLRGLPGPRGNDGDDGAAGAPGKSAYQLAVEAGYTGSLAAWLDSLKGAQGQAGTDGQDGANGIDGQNGLNGEDGEDGAPGKSAYQIAIENGFTGTEAQWLDSLIGPPGEAGAPADTTVVTKLVADVESLTDDFVVIDDTVTQHGIDLTTVKSTVTTHVTDIANLKVRPPQLAGSIAIIGAEIMSQYYFTNADGVASYRGNGLVTWAMALSRQRLQIVASPAAPGATVVEGTTASRTIKSLYRQLDDAIAAGASHVLCMGGLEDLQAGVTFAALQKGWRDFLNKAAANNIYVWLLTQTPFNVYNANAYVFQQSIMHLNSWLRKEVASRKGVRLIDAYAIVATPQNSTTTGLVKAVQWKAGYDRNGDGRRPNNIGAFYIGKAIASIWSEEFLDRDLLISSPYDSTVAHAPYSTNILNNPLFTDMTSITSVIVDNGGTNYGAGTYAQITDPSAGGSGAVYSVTVTAGVVTSVNPVADGSGNFQHGRGYGPNTTITIVDPTNTGSGAVVRPQFGPSGFQLGYSGAEVYAEPRTDGCGNNVTWKTNFPVNGTAAPSGRSFLYNRTMGASMVQSSSSTDTVQAMCEITAGGDHFVSGGPQIAVWGNGYYRYYSALERDVGDAPIPEQFTGVFITPPMTRGAASEMELRIMAWGHRSVAGEQATISFGRLSLRSQEKLELPAAVKTDVKYRPGHYAMLTPEMDVASFFLPKIIKGVAKTPAEVPEGIRGGFDTDATKTINTSAAMRGLVRQIYWRNHETTKVQSIDVVTGGTGYTNPTVTITDPGVTNGTITLAGTGAQATAVVVNGVITAINVTDKGDKYTPNAIVTITDPTGTGATATVNLYDFSSVANDLWLLDTWKNKDGVRVPKQLMVYLACDSYNSDYAERLPTYLMLDPQYLPAGDRPNVTLMNFWQFKASAGYTPQVPQFAASCIIPNGRHGTFTVTHGGANYSNSPTITWTSAAGGGTATATVVDGVIVSVTMASVTPGGGITDAVLPITVTVSDSTGSGADITMNPTGSGGKLRYHSKPIQDRLIAFTKALSKTKAKKWTGYEADGVTPTFELVNIDDHPAFEMLRFDETAHADTLSYHAPGRQTDYVDGFLRVAAETNTFFKRTTVSIGLNYVGDGNIARAARIAMQAGVGVGVVDMIPSNTSYTNWDWGAYTWIKGSAQLLPLGVHCDGGNYNMLKPSNVVSPQYPDVTLRGALELTGVTHMVWSYYNAEIHGANYTIDYKEVPKFLNSLGTQEQWEADPTGAAFNATIRIANYPAATASNDNKAAVVGATRPYITNA